MMWVLKDRITNQLLRFASTERRYGVFFVKFTTVEYSLAASRFKSLDDAKKFLCVVVNKTEKDRHNFMIDFRMSDNDIITVRRDILTEEESSPFLIEEWFSQYQKYRFLVEKHDTGMKKIVDKIISSKRKYKAILVFSNYAPEHSITDVHGNVHSFKEIFTYMTSDEVTSIENLIDIFGSKNTIVAKTSREAIIAFADKKAAMIAKLGYNGGISPVVYDIEDPSS